MAIQADYKKMTRILNETSLDVSGKDLCFKVHYWGAMPEHFDNPLHRHSFFEVCYVLEGEGFYYESEAEYPLQAGTLFCSRPGQWHQIKSDPGLSLFYVAFEINESRSAEEAIIRYLQLIHHNKVVVSLASESIASQTWRMLLTICKQEHALTAAMLQSLTFALLVSFYAEFSENLEHEFKQEHQQISAYLQRAKLYIEDNLSSSLSLHQLSNYLHITERHLSRLFADKVGQSFSHYVQEKRVQKSMELLLETDWAISRIAEETGFESVHYYTRVFTRKIGVPPGQFRKTQLSEVPFNPH